ncbi:hypothetical protein V8F06_013189 [Rhypophila decipiens]
MPLRKHTRSQLCTACKGLTLSCLETVGTFRHVTVGYLKDTEGSCDLCHLIWRAVERAMRAETNDPERQCDLPENYRVWLSLTEPPRTYISERPRIDIDRGKALYFYVAPESLPRTAIDGHLTLSENRSVGVQDAIKTVCRWIDEDIGLRSNSNGAALTQMHPTLLLELPQMMPFLPNSQLRLVDNLRSLQAKKWVVVVCPRLSTSFSDPNLSFVAQTQRTISFSMLTPLVRHAATATAMLGCRYLWVRDICTSDSDTDEIGDVFWNSYCAIVSHSTPADGNFLETTLCDIQEVPIKNQRLSCAVSYLSLPSDLLSDVEFDARTKSASGYLDRLMARRVIHFTPGHIYLESYGKLGTRSEEGTQLYTEASPSRPLLLPQTLVYTSRTPLVWFNFVERYTSCPIQPGDDRLSMVQPLAEKIHQSTQVSYLSGVWKDNFHMGLLWAPKKPPMQHNSTSRPLPSWSWAALEGPVQYPLSFEHRVTTTWNARCEIQQVLAPRPDFVTETGVLMMTGQITDLGISGTTQTGRMAQRLPLLLKTSGDTGGLGSGRLQSLGDVARKHNLGEVENPEQWEALGYKSISVICDPEVDEHTPVRNAIGFAVLDETPKFAQELVSGGSTMFWKYPCLRMAEADITDPPGVGGQGLNGMLPTRTFVLILEETESSGKSRLGTRTYHRIGIGLLQGDFPFADCPTRGSEPQQLEGHGVKVRAGYSIEKLILDKIVVLTVALIETPMPTTTGNGRLCLWSYSIYATFVV